MCPKEIIVLVMLVPILAPIIIGMALLSERKLLPTRATTIDVEVEELWMMLVDKIPIKSPTKGLFVADIIFSTKSFPKYSNATPRRIIL